MAPRYKSGPYRPTRGRFKGQEFASRRQYENAGSHLRGYTSRVAEVRAAAKRVGPKSHEKLSDRGASRLQPRAWRNLRMEREHISLSEAARREGTTVPNVHQVGLAGSRAQAKRALRGQAEPSPVHAHDRDHDRRQCRRWLYAPPSRGRLSAPTTPP